MFSPGTVSMNQKHGAHLVQFSEVWIMGQDTHSPGAVFRSQGHGSVHTLTWCSLFLKVRVMGQGTHSLVQFYKVRVMGSAHTPWCSFLRSRSRGRSIFGYLQALTQSSFRRLAGHRFTWCSFLVQDTLTWCSFLGSGSLGTAHTHTLHFPGVSVIGQGTQTPGAASWGQGHWAGHPPTWCSFCRSVSLNWAHKLIWPFLGVWATGGRPHVHTHQCSFLQCGSWGRVRSPGTVQAKCCRSGTHHGSPRLARSMLCGHQECRYSQV